MDKGAWWATVHGVTKFVILLKKNFILKQFYIYSLLAKIIESCHIYLSQSSTNIYITMIQ